MIAWRLRALNDWSEVVESSSLVVLLDLLDALRRQDRLRKSLTSHVLVKMGQVALVTDGGHEGCFNALLKQFLHI